MILLSVLLKPGVALGHFHEVGLRGLRSRRHMKIVWRWMRRQKLRLIFNHVGSLKQFLVLGMTWFTEPNFKQQAKPVNDYPQHKSPFEVYELLAKKLCSALSNFELFCCNPYNVKNQGLSDQF